MKKLLAILLFLLLLSGCAAPSRETTLPSTQPPETEFPGSFEVHYLDVGQADATLIICDGEYLLIDGGNRADSQLIYAYLKSQDAAHLSYLICTHAHEDHVGGLAAALNYAALGTVFCPVEDADSEEFRNFRKYLELQDVSITVPAPGTEFSLGSAECTILAVNTLPDDPNNSSIVLKVQYGNTAFLFSGDAEADAEELILQSGTDISCTVLKVPHHGSESSLTDPWLAAANPGYAVISCGSGNSYGHPHAATLEKLNLAGVRLFRTDLQGHIICRSDGENVHFFPQRNHGADTYLLPAVRETESASLPTDSASPYYVLNTNSQVFHLPSCSSSSKISDKNRRESNESREALISQGFSPCGICAP